MADIIVIKATDKTPLVEYNRDKGEFSLRGRSMPEDPLRFYLLVLELFADYIKHTPAEHTVFNFHFEYFNTASSKFLFDILKKIELLPQHNYGVTINWYYDKYDEDIRDAGENYSEMVNLEFNLLEA